MTFISNFFLKLYSRKSGVTYMPKKPRVRKLMDGQHVSMLAWEQKNA